MGRFNDGMCMPGEASQFGCDLKIQPSGCVELFTGVCRWGRKWTDLNTRRDGYRIYIYLWFTSLILKHCAVFGMAQAADSRGGQYELSLRCFAQVLPVLKYIKTMAFFQAASGLPESPDSRAGMRVLTAVPAVALQTRLVSRAGGARSMEATNQSLNSNAEASRSLRPVEEPCAELERAG